MKIISIFLSCLGLFLINSNVTFAQTEGVGYACNDWVDNDGDGLTDCDDSDCQYPANVEKGCNCRDGVDNDGDGFIDSGDADCAAFYGLSFIGEGSDCSIQPPVSTDGFNVLTDPTVSGQNTVDTQSKMAIGDIDGDGIPDVVATSKWNQTIRVIATTNNQEDNSDAGDVKSDWKSPGASNMPAGNWFLELEVAIADIDRDGKSELFTVASKRKNANSEPEAYTIVGFTYEEKSLVPLWDAIDIGPDRPGIFGLADFDGDGLAEIYVRNRIYAAETGELLADAGGDWDTEVNAAPVAINIDRSNPNLELVCGEYIYTVPNLVRDGNNATLNALTVWKNMNDLLPAADKYFPKTYVDLKEYGTDNFSSTSVADFDGDGSIDVFLSGARATSTGKTAVYYWNVATDQVQIFLPVDPLNANGWPWGTGRVNLGEVDGDGQLEANFIAGNQLFVLDLEAGLLTLKYAKTINDSRSGVIATTVYDFDNDGKPELVYRDAAELVVIDGETGVEEWAVPCESHTMTEGPIIADVNGDGGTDICVPCSRNGGIDVEKDGVQLQALGEIRLFYSAEGNWLPTRQVWNQSGYFVINILDDLTLPLRQMDMPIVFSDGPCDNGIPGPIRPFNTFLNQVPTLGPGGCPIYPGPDVSFNGDDPLAPGADPADPNFNSAANVIPPICGDLGIKAFFDIVNNGALPINTTIPVSFWDGNPTLATDTTTGEAAVLLHTYDLLLNNLQVGDSLITDTTEFNSTGRAFRLWIILNDDGATFPVTLDDPAFVECDIANNVYYIDIIPEPFTVEIQKNGENTKCDLSAPDNGELQAIILEEGVETSDYSKYGIQWYYGSGATNPIPAADGGNSQVLSGLYGDVDGEIYSLVVTNLDKGCQSLPVQDTVFGVQTVPSFTIGINSHQTVCSPPNGELEVAIDGGNTGFTIEWFDNLFNPTGITGPVASNLTEGEWIVRISSGDGCQEISSQTIDGPIEPDATATTLKNILDCEDLSSGQITAEAFIGGVLQDSTDYTFNWYYADSVGGALGSPLPPVHGSGPTRSGLPAGSYGVIVTDLGTQCDSELIVYTEVEDLREYPAVVISEVQPQLSCDPSLPNGILRADVMDGGVAQDPANYVFEWFSGDNTLAANLHTDTEGTNGEIANNVPGGGTYYTVRVTNLNNCEQTDKFIISEQKILPVLTLDSIPNTVCDESLASSAYTGQVIGSVTYDGTTVTLPDANYEFTWYQGSTTGGTVLTNSSASDNSLENLNGGYYTVVVTRADYSCESVPVTIEVTEEEVLPVIDVATTPMTTCSGAPNGTATATVDGGTAGYTFEWFVGTNITATGTNVAGATNVATGLDGNAGSNTYTVLATNTTTGCQSSLSVNIADNTILPTLNLTSTPNSTCDPGFSNFTGTLTASITDPNGETPRDINDYTFTWLDSLGNNALAISGSSVSQDSILMNIPSGTFSVIVSNDVLGCTSDPVSVFIDSTKVLPNIVIDPLVSMTACDTTLANGTATAFVVVGTDTTINNHSFEWYRGTSAAGTVLSATNFVDQLNGFATKNNYIVKAVNQSTGCESTEIIAVPEATILPTTVPTSTPNSICDPSLTVPEVEFNGTITIPVTDPNALAGDSYEFELFLGGVSQGTQTDDDTFTELADGTYEVTVKNLRLGCTSDPVTIVVDEEQILPVIDITLTPMTSCDTSSPNGGASALIGGTTTGYSFAWYVGPTITASSIGTSASITGLDGTTGSNTYTLLVTDLSSGCQSTESFNVPDSTILPTTVPTSTPNSICDPSLTNPSVEFNGTITIPVTDPNALASDSYEFELFLGGVSQGTQTDDDTFTELADGTYEVTVTNLRLGCTSDPVTIVVDDEQILPAIDLTLIPMTSCDPALLNGGASAEVAGTTTGFTFEWFEGTDVTIPANSLGTSASVGSLDGTSGQNTYVVLVTDLSSGCQSTESFNVPDSTILPTTVPTSTPNNICDPSLTNPAAQFNGTITIPVTDPNALAGDSYEFELFLGGVSQGTQTDDDTFTGLADDIYEVTVKNLRLGCTSDPVTIVVDDEQILPAIDLTLIPMTSCDPALLNGGASAVVGGTTSGFSFEWFEGSDVTIAANSLGTSAAVAGLDGTSGQNLYTVLVTDLSSGCQSTESFNVPDSTILPTTVPTSTPNNICDPSLTSPAAQFNGTITIPVTDPNALAGDSYEFELFLGGVSQGTQTDDNVFTELVDGTYEVTVTNIRLGCTSDPVTIVVDDVQVLPTIDLAITPMTTCSGTTPNGAASASIGGTTAGYSFEWFTGSDVSIAANSIGTSASIAELDGTAGANTYIVLVTDLSSGCQSTESFNVADNSELPTTVPTSTPNSICDPSLTIPATQFNGTITIPVTDTNVLAGDNYEFELFLGGVSQGTQTDDDTFTGLADGSYEVTVTNTRLGCTSDPVTIVVDDVQVTPAIDLTVTPMTTCDGTTPNGAASVEIGGTTAGYSFEWFTGSDVSIAGNSIGTSASIDELDGTTGTNTYIVLVTDLSSGCQSTESFNIADNSELPTFTLESDPNEVCDPDEASNDFTGEIRVVSFNDDNFVAGHTYTYTFTNLGSGTVVNQATATLSNLVDGDYEVTVTNDMLGCTSDPVQIEVELDPVIPVITEVLSPSTNCTTADNGEIEITTIDGATPTADYTINWYDGNVIKYDGGGDRDPDFIGAVYAGIPGAQNYTVEVINTLTGCIQTKSYTLADNSELPTFTLEADPNEVCDDDLAANDFTGEVRVVSLLDDNFVAGHTYTYTFTNIGTAAVVTQATATLSNLEHGDYRVTVTNDQLGCTSDPIEVEVEFLPVPPTITEVLTPSTNCNAADNGQIEITDIDGAAPTADYTINWYHGNSVLFDGSGNRVTNATGATYAGIPGGAVYTVEVINNLTGCVSTESYTLPDASAFPVVTLTKANNTICDENIGYDGTVTAAVTYKTAPVAQDANYVFTWYEGTTTAGTVIAVSDDTDQVLAGLEGGFYTVTVTNVTLGCTSSPKTIEVRDVIYTPVLNVAVTPQTNCVDFSGGLAVTIDETLLDGVAASDPADYTFTWYTYNNATQVSTPIAVGVQSADDASFTELPSGYYRVEVERNSTGCTEDKVMFVPESITVPTVTLTKTQDLTNCGAADGELDATIADEADYTFYWYHNDDAVDEDFVIANADATIVGDGTYPGLFPGLYTVVAVNNITGCITPMDTEEILDGSNEITINIPINTYPNTCGVSDGSMTAEPEVATEVTDFDADFTYAWYNGGPTNTEPINFFTNPPTFTAGSFSSDRTITGLGQGTYTVVVTYLNTGCSEYETINLPFQDAPIITPDITNSTLCPSTIGNGAIEITIDTSPVTASFPAGDPSGAIDNDNFTIDFYSGANSDVLIQGSIDPETLPGYTTNGPIAIGDNLAPGFYTIVLTEDYTGNVCPLTEVIEIKADALPPVITLDGPITPNTACVVSEADGEFEIIWAKHSNDNNTDPGVTYDLSISPDPNNVTGTAPLTGVGVGSFNFTQLPPDVYTIIVTASTGCSAIRNFTVTDEPATAEIANGNFSVNPANLCLPSGNAEITDLTLVDGGASEDMTDYEFTWFSDAALTINVTGPMAGDAANATGGDYLDLDALGIEEGTFYVVAEKTNDISGTGGVGCISTPFQVEIEDVSEDPVVDLVGNTNTACDTGYEGSVEIEVTDTYSDGLFGAGVATYDIVLTGAGGLSAGPHPFNGSDGTEIQEDLQEDTYTALVTNNSTGCTTSDVVTIVKNTQPLIINTVVSKDQEICDPDGTVEVTEIVLQGVDESPDDGIDDTDDLANYTFTWYSNSSLTTLASGDTDELIENLSAGEYYVVAKKSTGASPGSGCESLPYKEVIEDLSIDPVIALTGFANTACDGNFEGSFEIDVADPSGLGAVPGTLFTYDVTGTKGFVDNSPGQDGQDDTYTGREDDTYTVIATNEVTQCTVTGTVTIQKNAQPIIVNEVDFLDQTLCDPDGEIEVVDIILQGIDVSPADGTDDSDALTNYSFEWFEDAALTTTVGGNSELLQNIGAGDYYVVATKTGGTSPGSGCESAPYRTDIKDVSVDPVIALTGFANTACDGNFEGSFEIDVADPSGPGVGALFTYDVTGIKGFVDNSPNQDGQDDTYTGREDDKYTVIATNEVTQCTTTGTVTIQKNAQPIIVNEVDFLNQTICDTNGEIEVVDIILQGIDVSPADGTDDSDALTNYSFEWFEDAALSVTVGGNTELLQNIGAGDYYVVATKTGGTSPGSGCESAPYRSDIKDESVNPVIALTGFSNTACDTDFEGSIEIDVTDPSGPGADPSATFAYIFTGPTALGATTGETGVDNTRGNLQDGIYTVTATNELTQCLITGSVTIKKNTQPIIINTVVHTDQDICGPNGAVEVTNIILQGIDDNNDGFDDPDALGNYVFDWYNDAGLTDQRAEIGADIANISAGDYYVVARKVNGSPGSGCESAPYRENVEDISVNPVIALTGFSNTACDNNFEGSIEIDVADPSGPGTGATFAYTFTGPTAIGAATGETGIDNTRDNLADGQYTVIATNEITSCATSGTVTIQKNQQPIFVTSFNITDQDICTPNGFVEVSEIVLQGIDQDNNGTDDQDDLANYTFEWYTDAQLTDALADTDVNISDVAKGDYYVIATKVAGNPGSGCSTPPLRADVKDISVDPVIALTGFSNTACDNNFEGSIEIDVADPSGPGVGATFEYIFTGTTVIAGATGETGIDNTRDNLADGTYTVTAINETTGCDTKGTVTIQKNQQPIFVTNFDITDQDFCTPNGMVEVTEIILQGIDQNSDGNDDSDDLANYTFEWYEDAQLTSALADTDVDIADVAKGDYYVIATKVTGSPGSGCSTPPLRADIKDLSVDPVIALAGFSNTACDNNFEGSIEIDVADPSGPGTGATFEYIFTGPTVIPGTTGESGIDNTRDNLADGTYTVTALNEITGCDTKGTVTIQKNQQPIFVTNFNITDQDLCSPLENGAVEVAQIILQGIDDNNDGNDDEDDLANYTYIWFNDGTLQDTIVDTDVEINDLAKGDYYVVATKVTGSPGSGCSTPPLRADVDDISIDPVIALSSTSNSACDPASSDGGIVINVTDNGVNPTTYTYNWLSTTNASGVVPTDSTSIDASASWDELEPGVYSIEVVSDGTGCFTSGTVTVLDNPSIPLVQDADVIVTDQDLCDPSGSITINSVDPGVLTDYTFEWRKGADFDAADVVGDAQPIINNTTYTDISAGSYWFLATKNAGTDGSGDGCVAPPVRMEMDNISERPTLSMSSIANTACDNAFDASITLNLTEVTGTPGVGGDYRVIWTSFPTEATIADADPVSSGYTTGGTDLVAPGTYNVEVENNATGCPATGSITVQDNPQPIDIVTVEVEDQMICFPDGRITVTVTNPSDVPDYSYTWYKGEVNAGSELEDGSATVITSNELTNANYEDMGAGAYFIIATRNSGTGPGSGCPSAPFRADVDDLSVDPKAALTTTSNTACDPALSNGTINAIASEQDGTTNDYTFTWAYNNGSLPGGVSQTDVSPVSDITNAPHGNYAVNVFNTLTGCAIDASIKVTIDSLASEPNIIDVDLTLPLDCNPSGSAEVTRLIIGGVTDVTDPVALANDYDYGWFEGDFVPSAQIPDEFGSRIDFALAEGNYFITVTSLATGCESEPKEFIVDNSMIIYPDIAVDQTIPQINCIGPPFGAELVATSVEEDGSIGPGYAFTWTYDSLMNEDYTSLPGYVPTPTVSGNVGTAYNLPVGLFKVITTNTTTNCTDSAFFVVIDESEKFVPQVRTGAEPLTMCYAPNGVAFGQTISINNYPYPEDYRFDWYNGLTPDVSQPADYPNSPRTTDLPDGDYTVKVTDNNTGCITTESITINDERVYPEVRITLDNPVTNCDDTRPNGQLTAVVDNGAKVSDYFFRWFDAPDTTDVSTYFSDHFRVSDLDVGDYTVSAMRALTGCASIASESIGFEPLTVPVPTPVLLAIQTSCLDPNGMLQVSVDGQVTGYLFDWYEAGSQSSFAGDIVLKDLVAGDYEVATFEIETGCTSERVPITLPENLVYPEFEFRITPSACEFATGAAEVLVINNANINSVEWTDEFGFTMGYGGGIYDIFAGTYNVIAITTLGCATEEEVEVHTDILDFNLVAPNGNSANSYFHVDCISNFPDNHVQIYNRTGVLVWEATGYDNVGTKFTGVGANGLYLMGDELPEGTYFYIIDKKDGSKPIAGYLELIR